MSETENLPPAPVQDQVLKMKGSPLENVDSSKRVPFRDIANNPKSTTTPLKEKPTATPSRFEAIRQLDDEESWRDRTEVLTKFHHTAYRLCARELIHEIIEKLPGGAHEAEGTHKKKELPTILNFRETASRVMDDSVVEELNDTISSPVLDKTMDTLKMPVANSTLLNSTNSNPASPNRSDGVFETSLLSSFEKMKIKEEEEPEEDIFHDASDEFEVQDDASPEKDVVKEEAEQFSDTLDMLTNSLEKISVRDNLDETTDKLKTPVVSSSTKMQPLVEEFKEKFLPAGELEQQKSPKEQSHVVLADNLAAVDVNSDVKEDPKHKCDEGIMGRFDDASFNPFLIGTPADKAVSEEKLVAKSPLPCKPQDKVKAKQEHKPEAPLSSVLSAENTLVESYHLEEVTATLENPTCDSLSLGNSIVNSPHIKLSQVKGETNVPSQNKAANVATTETNVEQPVKAVIPPETMYDLNNLEDPDFDPFASRGAIVNSPDIRPSPQLEEPVDLRGGADMNNLPSDKSSAEEEKEAVSLEKNNDFENVVKHLDDTNFDPFAPNSVVNSLDTNSTLLENNVAKGSTIDPSIDILSNEQQCDARPPENNLLEVFKEGDLSASAIGESKDSLSRTSANEPVLDQLENEKLPSKGTYDLEILNNLDDPNCNPFTSKHAMVNSPAQGKSSEPSENKEGSENHSAGVISKNLEDDLVVKELSNTQTSPKRKYDEAFLDEQEVNSGCFTEVKTIVSQSEEQEMSIKENTTTGHASEQLADSREEDIVVSKKGYNLEFLEAVDHNPNFNPFATKTSVANTPEKKTSSESNKTEEVDKTEVAEAVTKETVEDKEEHSSMKKDYSEKSKAEAVTKKTVEDKEEHSSMKKDSSEKSKEAAVTDAQDLPLENKVADKSTTNELNEEVLKDNVEENKDELAVPSKGYQLDFLDNLDDPNFDPFSTKQSVVNSPGKLLPGLKSEMKSSVPKSEANETKKKKDASAESKVRKPISEDEQKPCEIGLKQNDLRTENAVKEVEREHSHQDKEQEAEAEIVVPSKDYQLDFLDRLDDPDINPFETKSSVSNSPGKDSPVTVSKTQALEGKKTNVTVNEKTLVEKKKEQVPTQKAQVSKEEDAVKVESDENKTSKSRQSIGLHNQVKSMEDCQGKSVAGDEVKTDVIPSSQTGYQMDFLDKLDDANFNPFVTKSSVSNSPKRNDSPQDTEEKDNSSLEKFVLEADDVVPPKGKAKGDSLCAANSSCKVKENKDETQQPKVADKVKMTTDSAGKQEDSEISLPKNEYQFNILDHLDDPNFNPFATKATVANSPKKNSLGKSKQDAEVKKPVAVKEQKDESAYSASAEECQPGMGKNTSPRDEPLISQLKSDDFDKVSQEALKFVDEVTPSRRKLTEKKTLQAPSQERQRDVFSPFLDNKFEEFVDAADLSQEKQEPVEGEHFQPVSTYAFFSNPEDLDVLGKHGTDGDKLNLVRNSLYMKFDPLVSGRQSLAPYLAQQKLIVPADDDPRRASVLISFSPSPDKRLRQPKPSTSGTPVRPLFKTQADETVVADTTSLNDTTLCDMHNTTVVASSATSQFSTTVISHGGKFHDDSVFHPPAACGENMVPEHVMNEKIKNMELVMQDKLLRQSRVLEDLQRTLEQQTEESSIAVSSLEEENDSLRTAIQKLKAMIGKIVEQVKCKQEENKKELVLMENKYELQVKALREESLQHQEELKKMEEPFHNLVKKYTRLQEVTESLRRNEESLKTEKEDLLKKLAKKEESFKSVLQVLEDKYNKAQQEYEAEKEQHGQELNKAFLMLKKAEVKIMSLTDTVEKTQNENRRLKALIDDISNKFS